VALITFILLGVKSPTVQVQLLVWIFVMRIAMLVASAAAYFINAAIAKARYANVDKMNFESPLTSLVWLTSFISIAMTFAISAVIIPSLGDDTTQWWKLASIISCGTLAGAVIPELVKAFTSTESRHVREVVTSRKKAAHHSASFPVRRRQLLGLLPWTGHGLLDVGQLSFALQGSVD